MPVAMKVSVQNTVDRDLQVTGTFEFFLEQPEDARELGHIASAAFTAFLQGYADEMDESAAA